MEENVMQNKKVIVIDTQNGTTIRRTYEDVNAETIGDFIIGSGVEVNYNKYKVVDQSSGNEVNTTSSLHAANANGYTVLYIVARKATRSGNMTRSELMTAIKGIMTSKPEAKEFFNKDKNYTNKSTEVLISLYNSWQKKSTKTTVVVSKKVASRTSHAKKTVLSQSSKEQLLDECSCLNTSKECNWESRITALEEKVNRLMMPKCKLVSEEAASSNEKSIARSFVE